MSTISVKRTVAMKLKLIGYWVTTAAIALETLAGGVTDLIHGGQSWWLASRSSRS